MILYEDTRQQAGKHKNIEAYCRKHGIDVVRQCLSVGDYMLNPVDGKISVDTKFSVMELAKDILSRDHIRFRSELIRAQEKGIQLVILTEEVLPNGRVDNWEVPRWTSSNQYHRYGEPMTRIDPKTLRKAMVTMREKYGVQFAFCSRRQSPAMVIKILKGEITWQN